MTFSLWNLFSPFGHCKFVSIKFFEKRSNFIKNWFRNFWYPGFLGFKRNDNAITNMIKETDPKFTTQKENSFPYFHTALGPDNKTHNHPSKPNIQSKNLDRIFYFLPFRPNFSPTKQVRDSLTSTPSTKRCNETTTKS